MHTLIVMTVLGADRPGLVESISELVEAHEGNWLESRLVRLGGQFAGVVRAQLPQARLGGFKAALALLEKQGLSIVTHAEADAALPGAGELARLEIVGHDRPGIVRQIAHVLAAHQVNVEELQSECVSAPMTGEVLFKAAARLRLPAQCDLARLRGELERIAADLLVDLTFERLN
ncbi:MAG TPA: ACT domain-containing protein [Methylomirabilota bacterium]|nr:ACT domain-containing protein [Methylomirabilota bacterium]